MSSTQTQECGLLASAFGNASTPLPSWTWESRPGLGTQEADHAGHQKQQQHRFGGKKVILDISGKCIKVVLVAKVRSCWGTDSLKLM